MLKLNQPDNNKIATGWDGLCALHAAFPNRRIAVVPSCLSEELQPPRLRLLMEIEQLPIIFKYNLSAALSGSEIIVDGNTYSVYYGNDDRLIDVILAPVGGFDTALQYFSWDGLSGLIGRVARQMGFKYGHRGLIYCREDGAEFLVTNQNSEILLFLGYDPVRYRIGFHNLSVLFSFVAQGTFFNRSLFLGENKHKVARSLDKNTRTCRAFTDWLDATPILPAYPYPADKHIWVHQAMDRFPAFATAVSNHL
jgi:hypothetical protein